MLSEFYITIEDFESHIKHLDKHLAEMPRIGSLARGRLFDTGLDLVNFADVFAQAHVNATFWCIDEARASSTEVMTGLIGLQKLKRRAESRAGDKGSDSARDLMVAYKAYFFFLRAFQDAAYAVLLNVITGSKPGVNTSMSECIKKETNEVHKIILATDASYIDWFKKFRDKRNLIKLGVNFSLCGPQLDVGVGFNKRTEDGGLVVDGDNFRINDLIQAFQYSDLLLQIIQNRLNTGT